MSKALKERRIELGKGADEIAGITRIKESYLKAIEEEDFSKLPIEVYTKGYIREYAKFLGVPSESVILRYEEYLAEKKGIKDKTPPKCPAKEKSHPEPFDQVALSGKSTEEKVGRPLEDIIAETLKTAPAEPKKGLLASRIIWVIPLAVIAVAAFFLARQRETVPVVPPKVVPNVQLQPVQPPLEPQQPAVQNQKTMSQAEPVKSDKTVDSSKPENAANKAVSAGEATTKKKKHNLEISATDKAWLQVVIDGSEKKEIMLNAGDKVSYGSDKSFDVLVGNAAGTKLKYDGKIFDNLGEKGQVVRMNFPEVNSTLSDRQPPKPSIP